MNKIGLMRCTFALVCVAFAVSHAIGSPMVLVGDVLLLPNRSEQRVPLMVFGGDAVQGLNLSVVVEGGGADFGGSMGPKITNVDVTGGTIFDSNNDGQTTIGAFDQVWAVTTATVSETVSANGVLAWLTFDSTGFDDGMGPFALSLSDPLGTPTDFAGIPADLLDGHIVIGVPEPSARLLFTLAVSILFLGIRVGRRERSRVSCTV